MSGILAYFYFQAKGTHSLIFKLEIKEVLDKFKKKVNFSCEENSANFSQSK
jgi:hypothetical protein